MDPNDRALYYLISNNGGCNVNTHLCALHVDNISKKEKKERKEGSSYLTRPSNCLTEQRKRIYMVSPPPSLNVHFVK